MHLANQEKVTATIQQQFTSRTDLQPLTLRRIVSIPPPQSRLLLLISREVQLLVLYWVQSCLVMTVLQPCVKLRGFIQTRIV